MSRSRRGPERGLGRRRQRAHANDHRARDHHARDHHARDHHARDRDRRDHGLRDPALPPDECAPVSAPSCALGEETRAPRDRDRLRDGRDHDRARAHDRGRALTPRREGPSSSPAQFSTGSLRTRPRLDDFHRARMSSRRTSPRPAQNALRRRAAYGSPPLEGPSNPYARPTPRSRLAVDPTPDAQPFTTSLVSCST